MLFTIRNNERNCDMHHKNGFLVQTFSLVSTLEVACLIYGAQLFLVLRASLIIVAFSLPVLRAFHSRQ